MRDGTLGWSRTVDVHRRTIRRCFVGQVFSLLLLSLLLLLLIDCLKTLAHYELFLGTD